MNVYAYLILECVNPPRQGIYVYIYRYLHIQINIRCISYFGVREVAGGQVGVCVCAVSPGNPSRFIWSGKC